MNESRPSNGFVWGIIGLMFLGVMFYSGASVLASQFKKSETYSQLRVYLAGPNIKLTAVAQVTQ